MENKKLTDSDKEHILELYNIGYNTVQIGKVMNLNNCTIGRILRKNGITPDYKRGNILNKDIEDICSLYKSGKTAKEILEKYSDKINCQETIMNIVKRNGIQPRKGGIGNNFDVNYFEIIDTEEKAYFLGLFLTDGNVHKLKRNTPQYCIQISLKYDDKYILERFRACINLNNKIRHYEKNGRNEAIFSIHSLKMAMDLKKYGIVERKTFCTELCYNIPDHLFRHYIRGIFDGDGTVHFDKNNNLRFGFYGTHKIIEQIQEYLYEKILLTKNNIFDKPTVSFVCNSRAQDIVNFYQYIYFDSTIYLHRKRDRFRKYFLFKNFNALIPR